MGVAEGTSAPGSPTRPASCGARVNLKAMRRAEPEKTAEVTELRRDSAYGSAQQRPAVSLAQANDVTDDHQSEGVVGRLGVADLAERNPKFRGPANRIDQSRDIPDCVPGDVLARVVVRVVVSLDAGRIHGKLVSGSPVVVRVDHDLQLLALRFD